MRLLITLEHRFSLAPDGSVWTKVAFDVAFWQRYLRVFDSLRIVARATLDPAIDQTYKKVTGDGVQFWPLPYYLGPEQFLLQRRKVRAFLHASVGDTDALLCRVSSPLANQLLPTFWEKNRPYGLEVVGDPYEALAPKAIRHPFRPLFRAWSTRSLARQCSRAMAVAYVTRETLQRRYPCPAHSVGVSDVGPLNFRQDAKVFTTNYSSLDCEKNDFVSEARHFRGRERLRILFVGSLSQMYKGPDILLKAIKLVAANLDPEVVVVGDGKHRRELEMMASQLGISRNVQFVGELPSGRAIRDQLDQATLFVMPSRTEGLPRVIIEAMTRAVPCIATRVGGIPELLCDEDLVDTEDHLGLANKIEEVVSTVGRLSRMSTRNLERAQEYRPELLTKRRDDFYRFLRHATEQWLGQSHIQSVGAGA
jgi:glycosyltransferase involved in cell wall biosynthesis